MTSIINITFQNESGAYNIYLKEEDVIEILNCKCLNGDYGNALGGTCNPKKEIIQALKINKNEIN